MGAICCGGSSRNNSDYTPPDLTPLKNGSYLFAAQIMKTTKNGKPIENKVMKKAMTEAEVCKMRDDPKTSVDMKMILNPPFNVCNRLTDFVFLSGIGCLTKENLEKLKINLIINATYEWPKICPIVCGKQVISYRVPVDDSGQDDISIYFDEVADLIEENARLGGHTIVHCMAGASRSTTLVLAYLMKHEGLTLVNAFKSVKKRRETGRPNLGFWTQLIKYEIKIKGKSSTKMITENVDRIQITFPEFYRTTFPELYEWEKNKQMITGREKLTNPNVKSKSEKVFNTETQKYE